MGSAEAFHNQLDVTGLILTKMDGDARGGAALSIRAVAGVPIKFIGTGEQADAMEPFYPERLAGRILGMGDVVSLVERAQELTTEQDAERLQDRMMRGQFNLEDFLDQLQKIKQMGPLSQLMEMIPGLGAQMRQARAEISDDDYKKVEAIIYSMTPRGAQAAGPPAVQPPGQPQPQGPHRPRLRQEHPGRQPARHPVRADAEDDDPDGPDDEEGQDAEGAPGHEPAAVPVGIGDRGGPSPFRERRCAR